MAYRPTWQGHLKLSLVTCPVALYTATNSGGDVHFNLINPATNNRIIPPESYSRHLRAIGQHLQQEGIDSFNLQCRGDRYAVWTRASTVTWPNRSLFNFSNRLENWWGLRHQAPDGYQSRQPGGHARFEYSLDDLARMDLAAFYAAVQGGDLAEMARIEKEWSQAIGAWTDAP